MIQVVLGLYAAAFFLTKEMLYNGVYRGRCPAATNITKKINNNG